MNTLFYSYDIAIESAYIITLKNNQDSQRLSARCQQSCRAVGQPFKVWDAFDGLQTEIQTPEHSINNPLMKMLKVTDHYLTRGEVACALSHISLWSKCAEMDKPIIILEHDSVMVKKLESFNAFNSIMYLGGAEWAKQKWNVVPGIPPHASEGPNYHFICRAHAYAIDPTMAKNLLAHVLKFGICAPLDIIIRADLFNITHNGLYAYDDNVNTTNDTTIKSRPLEGRRVERNDRLKD
jgi:GR25 family glycosyltransferase involved in LPS biosynthesis